MPEQYLYEELDTLSRYNRLDKTIPDSITDNLNPKFEIRDYQVEAFARFIDCVKNDFLPTPIHLLFNMATGSGKTLIMAGLILYLYEHGYRNFLFFVNADNIIEKTKDNFLNPDSSKYLFNTNIYFKGEQVTVTEVENFEGVNEVDINIRFTTIQKLHSDLMTEKENALTFDDFKKKEIVLLSDEAHHSNVSTKAQMKLDLTGENPNPVEKPTWENTVENIFNANDNNLLLEFTATFDDKTPAILEKYRNKVIYRYDLVKFRNDKYSKDIEIVRSDFSLQDRILQALILNHYKQSVAAAYKIQLKPVILFKGKTIPDSEKNKADFHKLIDNLTRNQIETIRRSDVPIIKQAFRFFDNHNTSSEDLIRQLKTAFHERYCLTVNSKIEREKYQVEVNRLEERDNPIRAIFAVQMLSEGWDVLNLFDIVRCYDTGSTGHNKIGKATIAEAQLIGRGARYYPFTLPGHEDKYKRKFDEDIAHELRVLEEFHYHSINDLPYITEIKKALVQEGLMDEHVVTRQLKLKKEFKETDLYKYGVIWLNKQVSRDYQHVKSFEDLASLSVKKKWHEHTIYEGTGGVTSMIERDETNYVTQNTGTKVVKVVDIEQNIVQTAIARSPFFKFSSLKRYFPQLKSMHEFKTSNNFLGGLKITFKGSFSQWEDEASEKLRACCDLLEKIEAELRKQITEYQGTKHFHKEQIHTIFKDKVLKFSTNNPRADKNHDAERLAKAEKWFAFNGLYGTGEEKAFVQFLQTHLEELQKTYDSVYLIRNERHFSIYNFFDGQAFQPDFVLFLGKENGETVSYQLFIEPKGEHIEDFDRWKEDFLKEINTERKSELIIEDKNYRIVGLPFYQDKNQNEFREALDEALQL